MNTSILTKSGVGILTLATLVGCSGQVASRPNATASKLIPDASSNQHFDAIPGQYPSAPPPVVAGQDQAPIGACVNLSGTTSKAVFRVTDCGAPDTNYRVIQRVSTPSECVGDADRRYYNLDSSGTGWTACMDLAWAQNECLIIQNISVQKVSCADSDAQGRQKPVALLTDTTSVNGCGTGGGFAHPVRRFTVCTEMQ